jgi:hypothetical protein
LNKKTFRWIPASPHAGCLFAPSKGWNNTKNLPEAMRRWCQTHHKSSINFRNYSLVARSCVVFLQQCVTSVGKAGFLLPIRHPGVNLYSTACKIFFRIGNPFRGVAASYRHGRQMRRQTGGYYYDYIGFVAENADARARRIGGRYLPRHGGRRVVRSGNSPQVRFACHGGSLREAAKPAFAALPAGAIGRPRDITATVVDAVCIGYSPPQRARAAAGTVVWYDIGINHAGVSITFARSAASRGCRTGAKKWVLTKR